MEANPRMSCREYQFRIGTERHADLAADAGLQTHLRECADCAQLGREMSQLSAATSLLEPLAAPADFAQRVHRGVRETTQVNSNGLLEKLFGPLRAPAPALQRQHVFAGLAVILVALVLLTVLVHPVGLSLTAPSFKAPSMAQPGGGQPVNFPARRPAPDPFQRPAAPPHAP